MRYTYFLEVSESEVPADVETLRGIDAAARALPRAMRVDSLTPAPSSDPYLDDGPGPAVVVEIRFPDRRALESAAASPAGAALIERLRGSAGGRARIVQEAFELESFDVPQATGRPGGVSYLVSYHRPAKDEAAFLAHYRAHHPPIMSRFAGLRSLELGYPADVSLPAPLPRADRMLFCEVSFDDVAALNASLASEVRHELRRDFERFPAFSGRVTHFAMVRSRHCG